MSKRTETIQWYLDRALWVDLVLFLMMVVIWVITPKVKDVLCLLTDGSSLQEFRTALITVSATLVGFLLTIITLIITMGQAHIQEMNSGPQKDGPTHADEFVSKKDQFYGTVISTKATKVFLRSTLEVGLAVVLLLVLQLDIKAISGQFMALLAIASFIIICLAMIRCFYIFGLFIHVHLSDEH